MRTANRFSSSRAAGPAATGERRRTHGDTLREIVEWLAGVGVTDHWVVSCYLKLEPRDRSRGKYLIKLKNRIKQRLAWLESREPDRAARDATARDLERMREYLGHPDNLPAGRGIAVFACEPLGLFETIALPEVFRSRLVIDRSPLVRELAALEDEFGLVLAAVCDRTGARVFRVTAGGCEELPSLPAADATRPGRFRGREGSTARPGPGTAVAGEHNYHQRIREEKHRHYARVAQRLFELARAAPVRGIVLAGSSTDAGAVEPHLHPYLGRLVLGTAKLNPKSVTPPQVLDTVLAVRRASERAWEERHVAALVEGLGTGWAAAGVDATLRALARGQVRVLLVDGAAERPGYRCVGSGRLATTPEACHGEGPAEPVPDVIDEAIEEALRQGSHIEVLEDGAARAQVDGLAALLRFSDR